MPSETKRQAGFFGIVKAIKSGNTPKNINPSVLKRARKVAKNTSEKTVNEFLTVNPSKALKK